MAKEIQNLVVSAPREGIAQSPHIGFGSLRNLDIFSVPGVAKLNNILEKKSGTIVDAQVKWIVKNPASPVNLYALDSNGVVYTSANSGDDWTEMGGETFTVTIATPAVFSATAHGLVENDTVVFSTSGALPTGLTAGTTYYIIATGLTADAFQVSASQGGAAVNTSGTQSGTHKFRATLGASGNGLAVWKGHVFVARNARMDVYDIAGTSWDYNWDTIGSDTDWHPMLVSKLDGYLYFGCGRYLGKILEVSGQDFDPDTAATYTGSTSGTSADNSLDLPEDYKIKCLAEQGNNLMIGTWQGTNIYDNKIADIFPWDGSSTTYGQPIQMNENGVNAMININGNLYILAGIEGKIYKSNGVQAWVIGQIPLSVADISGGKYLEPYPGAIMHFKGKLYFAVNSQSTDGMGIYSLLETSNGNILNFEHFISTETTGGTNPLIIGALLGITRDIFVAGWRDHTTYGIDRLSTTSFAYTTDYSGSVESPLYQVGTTLNKRKFNEMEFYLAKELAASEGIRIKFRINLTDTWTILGTYTTTNIGTGVTSHHEQNINIPECEMIQIRVETKGTATTTPEWKQIILI